MLSDEDLDKIIERHEDNSTYEATRAMLREAIAEHDRKRWKEDGIPPEAKEQP